MEEDYRGKKIEIGLTRFEILEMLRGKTHKGYKTKIRLIESE